jgi:hypothetical protein
MQYQPSAEDLLAAIAELLDDKLLPRCRMRSGTSAGWPPTWRILERQERLGRARRLRSAKGCGAARRRGRGRCGGPAGVADPGGR